MLPKMVAVFNTSLLNTCQVQSIDLVVGVVGGTENTYLLFSTLRLERKASVEQREDYCSRQIEVGEGKEDCRENANLKHPLIEL